jgi:endo-1,4-beta-xylanase
MFDFFVECHLNVARRIGGAPASKPRSGCALGLVLIVAIGAGLAGAPPALAQTTLVQNDFEDGALQGWIPRGGGVVLTNTTEVAHGGTHSLKTTGRTAGFNGPSLNVLSALTLGATYQVTTWVRLVAGTPATQLKITVQRTVNGSNSFDSVAQSAATGVTDSAWTQITGLYSFSGTAPTGLLLYIESSSTTASYYVDDFSIVLIANAPGPPPNTDGLSTGFESGTAEGWKPRIGNETLTPTTADAHSGNFSLLTTGRTAAFQGPSYDVTNVLFNGSTYTVSLWAKLAPGEASNSLRVSVQRDAGSITDFHTVVNNTTATYPVALANTKLTLYVESNSGAPSFYIDDVQINYVPPQTIETGIPSLWQTQSPYFKMGTLAFAAGITGVHAQLVAKHFNSITSENDMKWQPTEPTLGTFTFTNADAQVSFAQSNNIMVRGHNLVWHQQLPAYVFQDANGNALTPSPASHDLVLQHEVEHITGVLNHFAPNVGAFYAWDVVNEAIDPSQPNCLRVSPWSQLTGTDFIDTAFLTARQLLPPSVKLYYNDYSTTDPGKLACIIQLVAGMKSRGVPIDGIGHQMHINLNYPGTAAVTNAITQIANQFPGIDQQITEMDISVGTSYTSYSQIPASVLAQQGYEYRNYFNTFRLLQGLISSVTFWGQADDHTWLDTGSVVDAPLLFDQSLHAKPAYWGIVDQTQLPGINLTGSIATKSGPQNARVWTLTLSNPGPGTAYGAQIAGFALKQTSGAPCAPTVSGVFPMVLGDLATGASANANVTIDFTGCSSLALFSVNAPFSSSGGWNGNPVTGSPALAIVRSNQFR